MRIITTTIAVFLLTVLAQAQMEKNFYEIKKAEDKRFEQIKDQKGVGYKPYMRWSYEAQFDAWPDGNLNKPKPNLVEEYLAFKQSLILSADSSHNGNWTSFGSGNGYSMPILSRPNAGYSGGAGRINCIAGHPTNSNILFAGAPAGGLWKSTNGGNYWVPSSDGIPMGGISSIVFDHSNSNTMYVNTGDGDGQHRRGAGVLKSTDMGETWSLTGAMPEPANWYGYDLKMHPQDNNILIAAAQTGLYFTYDAGESWTKVASGRHHDIEFSLNDPSFVFIGLQSGVRTYQLQSGVLVSLGFQQVVPNSQRVELAVSPDDPSRLFAIFGSDAAGFLGLYFSDNLGVTWNVQSTTPNILVNEPVPANALTQASQASYDLALAVRGSDANDVLVGAINIWRTSDFGVNWILEGYGSHDPPDDLTDPYAYVHWDIHEIAEINGFTFACTDGGIFRSSDFGATWDDVSWGLEISQVYRLDAHPSTPETIIGGCQDIGTNVYNSSPEMEQVLGADGMGAVFDEQDPLHVYVTKQNGNLYESNDGGWSYTNIPNPNGRFYTHFIVNPADGGDIYFGATNGLSRVMNGATFDTIPLNPTLNNVRYMDWSPSNQNVVYAASLGAMWVSTNALAASPIWNPIAVPWTTATPIRAIDISPTSPAHIWVTCRGWVAGEKVYESFDSGQTWINRSDNLPNVPIHCVMVDPFDTNNGAYLGTEIGVFYRNQHTDGWMWFGNGMPVVAVYDFDMDIAGQKLRVGTFGRGVWESPIFEVCDLTLNLTPENDPSIPGFSGTQVYETGNTLTSTRTIEGGDGTDVSYQAGDYIELQPGFEAKSPSEFVARTGPCSGSALP